MRSNELRGPPCVTTHSLKSIALSTSIGISVLVAGNTPAETAAAS